MKKTDMNLKDDIEQELRFDPKVNAAQIGVSVDKGAVMLTGEVDTYAAKWATEDAVKRVGGVTAVAQELMVKPSGVHVHSDMEIAEAAVSALRWDVWVPGSVKATVQRGRVSLEGRVGWKFQHDSAERAVRNLSGVVSVTNNICLEPAAQADQVKEKIEASLQRQAKTDAQTIGVSASGGTVTLSGKAGSWHAIEGATSAAWAAPGVTNVIEKVVVSPF